MSVLSKTVHAAPHSYWCHDRPAGDGQKTNEKRGRRLRERRNCQERKAAVVFEAKDVFTCMMESVERQNESEKIMLELEEQRFSWEKLREDWEEKRFNHTLSIIERKQIFLERNIDLKEKCFELKKNFKKRETW